MKKLLDLLSEIDAYNIGMKTYKVEKPKLSQNESEKIKGVDGTPCWRGYRYAGTENGKDKCVPIKEQESCTECGGAMYEGMCLECDMEGYGSEDHEVSMAQNQLRDIISNANQLMTKIGTQEINIPGWVQDHISQAQNYISQANVGFHEL